MQKINNEDLGRPDIETYKQQEKIPVVIVLDDVRSLNNVGSIFRTADAFMVEKIHLCGITGKPPHRDIQKTALGATESVDWSYEENISEVLRSYREQNYTIMVVEQVKDAVKLNELKVIKTSKYVLVFGSEVGGVSERAMALADNGIEVPQFGTKHSLNIAVCVGVVCWEILKQYKS